MTSKKYRIVEQDNFKYTLECKICNAKFRVPKNHGRIIAKCPSCQMKHSVDTDEVHSGFKTVALNKIREVFYKNGQLDIKMFYAGVFAICIIISMFKSF